VCTVVGYVHYDNGKPAIADMSVTDIDLGTTYEFRTGGEGWPAQNFYMKSFTCNWQDRILLTAGNVTEVFTYDKYPYEVNFTIKAAAGGQSGPGGGGSSGGSGGAGPSGSAGPAASYDFGKPINRSEVSIVANNTRIRWYVLNDTLGIKMIMGDVKVMHGYAIVKFSNGKEVRFDLGDMKELDLDDNGEAETRGQLVEIKDGDAYLFFDKIPQIPKIVEEIKEVPKTEEPQASNRSLIVLLALLAISFALVIITDWKRRK
jgi:hypothetical protein